MRLSKEQREKILKKIRNLDNDYWEKRFTLIQEHRDNLTDDLNNEIIYLFGLIEEQINTLVESYLTRYGVDGQMDFYGNLITLKRNELSEIKNDISITEEQLKVEGLEFDRDIQNQIKGLSTKTRRIDGLKLRIRAKIFYLYSVMNKRISDLMVEITDDAYYRSQYEIFNAAGYGKEDDDLKLLTLATILSETWRQTGETFDDAIWRYGRSFAGELNSLVGRLLSMEKLDSIEIRTQLEKIFRSKRNELRRNIITDSTFFSTRGTQESYITLEILECIYTAILDEKTCETCGELDGTVIPVEDVIPWENSPPIHNYCRCVLTPIITAINWLTGEVYEIEDSYDEWYSEHIE